jgi:hypothetical protein
MKKRRRHALYGLTAGLVAVCGRVVAMFEIHRGHYLSPSHAAHVQSAWILSGRKLGSDDSSKEASLYSFDRPASAEHARRCRFVNQDRLNDSRIAQLAGTRGTERTEVL